MDRRIEPMVVTSSDGNFYNIIYCHREVDALKEKMLRQGVIDLYEELFIQSKLTNL